MVVFLWRHESFLSHGGKPLIDETNMSTRVRGSPIDMMPELMKGIRVHRIPNLPLCGELHEVRIVQGPTAAAKIRNPHWKRMVIEKFSAGERRSIVERAIEIVVGTLQVLRGFDNGAGADFFEKVANIVRSTRGNEAFDSTRAAEHTTVRIGCTKALRYDLVVFDALPSVACCIRFADEMAIDVICTSRPRNRDA